MIISLLIIALLSFSGLCLTYLFSRDETFLWRLSAGNIIGSAVFGIICFITANFFGFSLLTILISLVIALAPLLLLKNAGIKKQLKSEWQRGKDRNQGASFKKFLRLFYYIFFIVLFVAFFDRAMIVTQEGIFTGGSQNLGDLPFHLGAIFSFTDGNNFPPQNPSFAGAKFTYSFIADFLTACLMKFGASVQSAMFIQNVSWAFSLLVVLESLVKRVTGNKVAAKIAPFLLFFSGGLGFVWFLKDYWYGAHGFFDLLWNLPRDYTIGEKFRWGNSLVVLFITQRSLLFGMPLTLIVLGYLWRLLNFRFAEFSIHGGKNRRINDENPITKNATRHVSFSAFAIGLFAGLLPLIHAHSLVVLFVVSAFLFFFSLRNWKLWISFGIGVSVLAVPQLVWVLSGSATHTSEFIGWHFGWDARQDNIFWFWIKNTGIFIPLLITAIFMGFLPSKDAADGKAGKQDGNESSKHLQLPVYLLVFFLPFLFLFIVTNIMKFAPWEWDNIKILIYWFVGTIPLVALFLAWMWQKGRLFKGISIGCLLILTLSGALDVWRTVSGQIKYDIFDKDAVKIAELIKEKTDPQSLFLHAPTYNSAVVLSGRRSLMRYIGHLSSHGIDYKARESDLKRIYSGSATAGIFLKKHDIDYVLISPKETESLQVNEKFFKRFKLVFQVGKYRVYKVK